MPVVRRVSRIEPAPGNALYVVALVDRSEQKRIEDAVAVGTAELAATLESVADGVLVVDLAGHISHFNRRFAELWELPDEMLLLRADDEVFDWMRQRVAEPASYMRRLAEIDDATMLRATDTLPLRSGAVLERVDAAAAEPGPADRPRVLVPGPRRRRVLRALPRAARAPGLLCSAIIAIRRATSLKSRPFNDYPERHHVCDRRCPGAAARVPESSPRRRSFPAAGGSAARTPR